MDARAWLRVVLYRAAVQFGWLWLAAVAWFAVWGLPDGRWNRQFDAHAIGTVTRIYGDGADPPDLRIEYVFRDTHGVEHTNYGIDEDTSADIKERRELDVAYAANEPQYSELRVPGVRSRYSPVSFEIGILCIFALGGFLPIVIDTFRARGEARRRERTTIAERGTGPREPIWYLLLLPAATLVPIATLLILYYV